MIEFTVPGSPVGKQRARVTRRGAFTPKKTQAYEASVAAHARIAMMEAGAEMAAGPVAVQIVAYMPDRRRRDIDNVIKAVMDGLNGVLYHDDAQVHEVAASKRYDKASPRTVVAMTILEET